MYKSQMREEYMHEVLAGNTTKTEVGMEEI